MDDTSRSARKRESEALQKLGTELVKLREQDVAHVPLPEELAGAVALARRLPKGGGLRRQMQHIGALMRQVDAEPIRAALAALRAERSTAAEAQHAVEHWRDRLIREGEPAIADLLAEHPDADTAHLHQLVAKARHEHTAQAPPRAARELFRYLRDFTLKN
jgi:ribosome-associated protein